MPLRKERLNHKGLWTQEPLSHIFMLGREQRAMERAFYDLYFFHKTLENSSIYIFLIKRVQFYVSLSVFSDSACMK